MTETTIETTIDWEKCWQLATQLGAHTRALIVEHDYEGTREWALQMISQQGDGSPVNSQRALSYFELAVLLGHRGHVVPAEHDDVVERIAWVTTLAHAAKAELAEVETRLKAIQQKVEAVDEGQQEEVDGDERDDG